MTLNKAPWAIDGARSTAGLARLAAYASGGGRSGVVQPTDLKVSSLAVPGNGLRLASGGASILNRYLTAPDESYVVSNPGTHTVPSASMPSAKASLSYYLVCIVVGDPAFNQTGHPFMPSGILDPAVAAEYEYVRVVIVPCTVSTTSFDQLGLSYPGMALARLEVPANTTTITNAMITDLRVLSKPNESSLVITGRPSGQFNITTPNTWANFGDIWPYVQIPKWATEMQILTYINSVGNDADAFGEFRNVIIGHINGASEIYDIDGVQGRSTLMTTTKVGVVGLGGDSVQLKVEARKLTGVPGEAAGYAYVDGKTQFIWDVRFAENIV